MPKKSIRFKPKKSGNATALIGIIGGAAALLVVVGILVYALVIRNKDSKDTAKNPDGTDPAGSSNGGSSGGVDLSDLEELDLSDYGIPFAMLAPPVAKQKDYYVDERLSRDHHTWVDMNPKFNGSVNFRHYPGQTVSIANEIQKERSGTGNNSFKLLGQNEYGFYYEQTPPIIEYVGPGGGRREGGKPLWQVEMFIPAGGRIWQISCHTQDVFSRAEADRRWAILQKIRVSTKTPEPPHPMGNPPGGWWEYVTPEFRLFVRASSAPSPEKKWKAETDVPWASTVDSWTFIWWTPRLNQRLEIYRLKPDQLKGIQADPEAFLETASTDVARRMILQGQKGVVDYKKGFTADKKPFREVVLKGGKDGLVCMNFLLDGDRLFVFKVWGEEIKDNTHEYVKLFNQSFLLRPAAKR